MLNSQSKHVLVEVVEDPILVLIVLDSYQLSVVLPQKLDIIYDIIHILYTVYIIYIYIYICIETVHTGPVEQKEHDSPWHQVIP